VGDLEVALRYYLLVIAALEAAEAVGGGSVPSYAQGEVVEANFDGGGAWYY
jgi:hypothetical protein